MLKGESKKEDAITPRRALDGKLSRDGEPDQSESAKGVEAQLGGSRAGCLKQIDPYKGTGAIPKRPKQGNSSKPETSSSKETLSEETDESKEKSDIFSKGEIVPVQGERDNNVDLYCKTHGKNQHESLLGFGLRVRRIIRKKLPIH